LKRESARHKANPRYNSKSKDANIPLGNFKQAPITRSDGKVYYFFLWLKFLASVFAFLINDLALTLPWYPLFGAYLVLPFFFEQLINDSRQMAS